MALNLSSEIIKPENNSENDAHLCHEPVNESPQEYELLSAFRSELVELPEFRSKTHKKKQTKNFKCEICKRKFRLKNFLNLHVLTHTGAKPFKCSVCDKKFTQKSSLNTHVKQFHASNVKMFECGDCNKKFKLKYFLDMHNFTHNGLKPNKCGLCGSKFTQKSSLNTHVKQFHGSSVEMFECMRCDKKFLRESMLDKHIENHPYSNKSCPIFSFPFVCYTGSTIRHGGVLGLWAACPGGGTAPPSGGGRTGGRHLGRLGGLINNAVNAGKRAAQQHQQQQDKQQQQQRNKHGNGDVQWCFSQVKGTLDDDVTEADIISCVEFNHDGELLATGDKGGRVVIFQRDPLSKTSLPRRGEYNVYSTFQSHEPEFDYLKSLEIEEKINKIRWLKRKNQAHFLLSTNDKTIKLWKVSERDKRVEGYNTRMENGSLRDPACINSLKVPTIKPMELMVEASPRRIFANAHTYHINSISVNSDQETYLSADDLRINLWHLEITDQSFNIVDIKPTNMEELTEVITAAEFHPVECNLFVYSSSKGTIRLCDMRAAALCDRHSKLFEEPEDPTNRSFFSEIISSISDVKLSNSGRYMISRDYLSVKVWDLHMETKPIETYPVHEYLRAKLCSLYENDCIFDKFECCWNGNDTAIMTGSYNNFFRMFDRTTKREVTLEASRDIAKPKTVLKPRKVCTGGKRKKDEISVDCLDFNKKILHTAWHPTENIIAVAATNNLFLFQDKF